VRLVTSTQHDGLTIPLDAVQQGPQGQFVFVVGQDHKVAIRTVSMCQSFKGVALIEKGLNSGEIVVIRGQYRLSPGTLVSLADPNDPDAVPHLPTWSLAFHSGLILHWRQKSIKNMVTSDAQLRILRRPLRGPCTNRWSC
jgi:hypothetical protein